MSLFARGSQENFFRYMREHYSLDRLVECGTEPVPDAISEVNPQWRKLDSQIRSKTSQRYRLTAQFGALALSEQPTESELQGYQQRKGKVEGVNPVEPPISWLETSAEVILGIEARRKTRQLSRAQVG